jgi:hypothetical protein
MELTATHRAVLKTIGPDGANRMKLGPFADGPEMVDLVVSGYVVHQTKAENGQADAWHLTHLGATAIGFGFNAEQLNGA